MMSPFIFINSLTIFCWLVFATLSSAEMQLLHREMFSPTSNLTAGQPGSHFTEVTGTLVGRPGGPRLAGQPPASADLREQGIPAIGRFKLSIPLTKIFVGGWFFFKDTQGPQVDLLNLCDIHGNASPTISIDNGVLGGGIKYNSFLPANLAWKNRWIYLGIATHLKGGTTADVRFYYKLPGQPMLSWTTLANAQIGITGIGQVVAGSGSFGTVFKGRVGAPSVYTFTSDNFSDIAYPSDVLEPVTKLTWYCDPLNGNDSADGTTPATAWKTAAKLNLESRNAGMFSANSPEDGDVLIINTQGAPLDLMGQTLLFSTDALHVRAAVGQDWVQMKGFRSIPNASWQPTSTSKVFSTTDTQPDIVLWDDDRFMNHPVGATFAAVSAQLSSTPGSFWTDGSTLYVHPFNSTDPRMDGKRYERSYRYTDGAAVLLNAANLTIEDIRVGKTCLADKLNNDPIGGYCMGFYYTSGYTVVKHCYLYYGSKHNIGLVQGEENDLVLLEDVQCEQGSPYALPGGQTLFVSFNHRPLDLNIKHRFVRCRSIANAGLIGSVSGTMTQSYPVFYSHNLETPGEPSQFAKFEFINCDFGMGNIQGQAVKEVYLEGTRCGAVFFQSVATADACTFSGMNTVLEGSSMTERNCIHEIKGELRMNPVAGSLNVQGCTIDARQVTGVQGGIPQSSLFTRVGSVSLIFKNNLVMMPTNVSVANVFSDINSTDTLQLDYNAYQLGSSTLFYRYQGNLSSNNLNLNQWKLLGQDSHSLSSSNFVLNGLRPVPRSPLIDAGVNLGVSKDRSGQLFQRRNDIGAYEVPSATYSDWKIENFTPAEIANDSVSGPGSTYQNDGLVNLLKYAIGIRPDSSGIFPLAIIPTATSGGPSTMSVIFTRSRWPSDLTFQIKLSNDLIHWQTAEVISQQVTNAVGDRESVRVLVRNPFLKVSFVKLDVLKTHL